MRKENTFCGNEYVEVEAQFQHVNHYNYSKILLRQKMST